MLKRLRAFFPAKPNQLVIHSKGQQTCGVPREQIREVIEWLGLSLQVTGYQATAHMIWDKPDVAIKGLDDMFRDGLRRDEPIFLYRCGDRPSPTPPAGYYWRLMPGYPSRRMYQLEQKDE